MICLSQVQCNFYKFSCTIYYSAQHLRFQFKLKTVFYLVYSIFLLFLIQQLNQFVSMFRNALDLARARAHCIHIHFSTIKNFLTIFLSYSSLSVAAFNAQHSSIHSPIQLKAKWCNKVHSTNR